MQRLGVALIVVAYALLAFIGLSAPVYAASHQHDAAVLAPYAAPWPVTLTMVVAGVGVMLALVPVRRGERWAIWTTAATFAVLFVVRMTTDPRCLLVLNPHEHGCHTFMLSMIVGVAGLVLAGRR